MKSKERILTAIKNRKPDRVPYMELLVDEGFGKKLLGRNNPIYKDPFKFDGFEEKGFGFIGRHYYTPVELCEALKMDAWGIGFCTELAIERMSVKTEYGLRTLVKGGIIKNKDDLKKIKLGNLKDNKIFEYIEDYISKYKRNYAVFAFINMGWDPTIMGLGWNTFSYALNDDISLIEETLDVYTNWAAEAVEKLCEMNLDFIWFADDIAYKSGLMFSPDFYREICIPRFKKVVQSCNKPWIYHSDGNYLEIIEDLISLGSKGFHPIEPLAIDIFDFKKNYGNSVCVIGNIDLDKLARGSGDEVCGEVERKVRILSKDGGYIMSSSSSLTDYCKVENVKEMIRTFERVR